jgi:hypothetical protein
MDLMRARVTLRERPLLDVFDLAVRFCALHAGAYTRLSLAVLLPGFAASWAVAHYGGWWLAWVATVAATSFATAPFLALASRLVFADSVGTGEALRMALRALPRLMGIRFLQLLALLVSTLLFWLPWLWIGTVLLFVVEVVILEQAGVGASFGRAQRIANANFSSGASTMLILLLAPIGAAMLADVAGREVLQTVLEIKAPPSMFREGGSWLALAGWWSTLPILATSRFFVYLDTRTRTEGWDIQTRFAAIATRATEETGRRQAA